MLKEKEFDWQGVPFKRYIEGYIANGLKELADKEVFATPSYITAEIMKPDMDKGLIFEGGEYEALSFIKEYFWEAVDTHDRITGSMEATAIDPLLEPEKFTAMMIETATVDMISESEFINEHFDEKVTIDKVAISKLKRELGIENNIAQTKSLTQDMDLEV